jgi:hypothetical protein
MTATTIAAKRGALGALSRHWPEYLIEAAGLGLFMISACAFTVLLEHPGSLMRQTIEDPVARRLLIGDRDGLDRNLAHLFALGQAIRRAPQSGGDAHLFQARQDRAVGLHLPLRVWDEARVS